MGLDRKLGFVFMVSDAGEDAPEFHGLMKNMLTSPDLQRLLHFYPTESTQGLALMVRMHEELSNMSAYEFPHERFFEFIDGLLERYAK